MPCQQGVWRLCGSSILHDVRGERRPVELGVTFGETILIVTMVYREWPEVRDAHLGLRDPFSAVRLGCGYGTHTAHGCRGSGSIPERPTNLCCWSRSS